MSIDTWSSNHEQGRNIFLMVHWVNLLTARRVCSAHYSVVLQKNHKLHYETICHWANWHKAEGISFIVSSVNFPIAFRTVVAVTEGHFSPITAC